MVSKKKYIFTIDDDCFVDFIIGRDIEVGGIYKGTVTSIKEYGAFVDFNGGQQGLLHISELSHEPDDLNDKEAVVEASINSKNLKLGMKVIAKVHQIRARGIVLDLGDGIRGMYRFEAGGRRDFEVGGELRVKCSSFTSKGIPVMSMVEDE